MAASRMVDWDLAVAVASKMAGDGPDVSPAQAAEAVAELRAGAARSTSLVRDFTGLIAPDRTALSAPVVVVDRPGWIQANADGFAQIISPLIDKLQEKKGAPGPLSEAIGSRVTGMELGGLLGFLSTKVLGQFDPFYVGGPAGVLTAGSTDGPTAIDRPSPTDGPVGGPSPTDGGSGDGPAAASYGEIGGRLLLVAPNVVQVERDLGVDPSDFRLWVCLHEETHRVQFTAVPWMRDHLRAEMARVIDGVEVDPVKLLGETAKRIGDLVRGADDVSLLDLVQSPEQKVIIDRITGVMSLLEGHADVVMDGVGPGVIGSVDKIRAKFNERRKGVGTLDRVLRRLLGLDQKMAQYRDGAAFVRGVIGQVGMEGFNQVWAEPANLPSKAEIGDPQSWVARVHG